MKKKLKYGMNFLKHMENSAKEDDNPFILQASVEKKQQFLVRSIDSQQIGFSSEMETSCIACAHCTLICTRRKNYHQRRIQNTIKIAQKVELRQQIKMLIEMPVNHFIFRNFSHEQNKISQ